MQSEQNVTVKKARIFLVDDHPVVRQGIARLVTDEGDMEICGEAESAADAMVKIKALCPDAVILDITLKGVDGLELLAEIVAFRSDLPVLILSMHDESIYAERVLRAGAKGYVMKEEAPEKVRAALRTVMAGELCVSSKIVSQVLGKLAGGATQTELSPLQRLTDRELQVFRCLGDGMPVRQIAELLFLSAKTVEAHREHIKHKLGIKSSSELLRYAIETRVNRV